MHYFCIQEGACELTDGARPPTNTFRACSGRIAAAEAAAWLVLLRALLLWLLVLLAGIAAAWAAVRLCSPLRPRLTMAAAVLPDAGTRLLLLVPMVAEGADDDLTSALVPNLDAPLPDDDVVDALRVEEPCPDDEDEVVIVALEPEDDEEGAGKESVASRGTARLTSTVRPSSTWRSTAHT